MCLLVYQPIMYKVLTFAKTACILCLILLLNSQNQEVKYGERAIAEGELITFLFPNPRVGRRYQN